MTVARNRAVDALRRAGVERRKLRELPVLGGWTGPPRTAEPEGDVVDDRLRLIFTCYHPALALDARVAFTLRTVCGVPTGTIAGAFLVTESAMTRRLTRAKTKIAQARIPFRVPEGAALAERLPGVLAVLYALFTQGYNVDGQPAFADEAIRVARLLRQLLPDQPEVNGLLALLLLQHSRRYARRDPDGNLLTLDQQDRDLWDQALVAEGLTVLSTVTANGPYTLQARIAACHTADQTDWPTIAHLYDHLAAAHPSPVIMLNRAVAHGFATGPAVGLAMLAEARQGDTLNGYMPAIAAEAELQARAGNRRRAAHLFYAAADLASTDTERRALMRRAADVEL
jgi:RNA polymerase sigma-70 factor (ECF subfamily)